jgi:hypothetical protein
MLLEASVAAMARWHWAMAMTLRRPTMAATIISPRSVKPDPAEERRPAERGPLRWRMTLGTVEHPVRWRTPRTSGEGTSGQRLWGISGAGVTILVGRGKSVLKLNLKPKRLMLMSKPTENRPTGQTPVTSAWVMP